MKIVLLVLIGLLLGLLAGAVIGVGVGLAWISVFHTSGFEGYSGMLVFYAFMPIGSLVGGLLGAIGLGMIAGREAAPTRLPPG